MRTLAALLLAFQAGPQDPPPAAIQWKVSLDTRFTMKFSSVEQYRCDTHQKNVGTDGLNTQGTYGHTDRREIEADLAFRELPGWQWALSIDLKRVSWTYGSDEAEVTVTCADGKEPQARVVVKEKEKARVPQAKADADNRAEHMKRMVLGEYDLAADRAGMVSIVRKGAIDPGFSLFGRPFLQPPCTAEPLKADQEWKDPVPPLLPGAREIESPGIVLKVASVGEKAITLKGAVNLPLTKPLNASEVINGTFSLERESVFSREGYVQSAREEYACRKTGKFTSTPMKGRALTREETVTASFKQLVTLKPRK
jgi:hypothetical protein